MIGLDILVKFLSDLHGQRYKECPYMICYYDFLKVFIIIQLQLIGLWEIVSFLVMPSQEDERNVGYINNRQNAKIAGSDLKEMKNGSKIMNIYKGK